MFEKHTDVDKRLKEFREIRKSSKSVEDVLSSFSKIKIQNRYLDYWTPADWPNTFEILEMGYFCTTGISIMMHSVLSNLSFIDPDKSEWKVISNHVTGKDGAIFINEGLAYNLVPGEAIDFAQNTDKYIVLIEHKNLKIPT